MLHCDQRSLSVHVAECKQFDVCIAGDNFFWNFKPTSIILGEDQKEINFLRMWMVFCLFIAIGARFSVYEM